MTTPLALSAFILLTVTAALLALAETSLTHIGRARAKALEEDGHPRGAALVRLLEHRDRALNPILFVIICCHLGAATVIAVWADDQFGGWGIVGAFFVEVLFIFVLAEAMPKTYALSRPDATALQIVPIASFLSRVPPLRWMVRLLVGISNVVLPGPGSPTGPSVSEEELLALAGAAAQADVIDAEEQELIESIIEFGDTIVREVMVPRPDMVSVGVDYRVTDVIEVVILNGFSRLPVVGDGIDDIQGVAHTKDLVRVERDGHGDEPVSRFARPARFVPESKRVAELLKEMQAEQNHMAVVIDEYGGTAGLVTLEDLIEELVGEIVDEFDVEEALIEELPGGSYDLNARMPLDEVNELIDGDLPEGEWDSIGGLLLSALGHVPTSGEAVEIAGVRMTALRVDGRRIGRVRIDLIDAPVPGDAEGQTVDAT